MKPSSRLMILAFALMSLGLAVSCASVSNGPSSATPSASVATTILDSSSAPIPEVAQPPAWASKQSGDLVVWIFSAPTPPVRGNDTLEAFVTDASGQPIADAEVSFDIDMTNMSHGKNVVTASSLGDGHYSAQLHFLMPGPWRVIVGIQRGGQQTSVRFDVMLS